MMRAEIRVQGFDRSQFLADTLMPEAKSVLPKTEVELKIEDGELVMRFGAEDVNSLRASLNSYLRWMRLALDTQEAVGGA